MSHSFEFDSVTHFTVGAIGEPGRRVFLLQAGDVDTVVTLKTEKQQIAALCEFIGTLLADLPSPGHLPDDLDLQTPPEVAWIAGSIAVTYDDVIDRLIIVVDEAEFADVTEEPDGVLQLSITREQAAAVAIRGASLVEAGRPPCPLCGAPLDPNGHACPRTNGHRPPQQ